MPITRSQALAFVAAILDSKPVRFHFEALLGHGRLPEVGHFDSQDRDVLDRCEEFAHHIWDCAALLSHELEHRARQGELDLEKPYAPERVRVRWAPEGDAEPEEEQAVVRIVGRVVLVCRFTGGDDALEEPIFFGESWEEVCAHAAAFNCDLYTVEPLAPAEPTEPENDDEPEDPPELATDEVDEDLQPVAAEAVVEGGAE